MALDPISEMRQQNHPESYRTEREVIEKAATFCMTGEIANIDAGDHSIGTLLYDAEYIGGWVEIDSDDDGTAVVEKWDDVGGSTQTSISAIATIDGGVDLGGALTTLGTSACLCPAGYKINILTVTFDGSKVGTVNLFFKSVEDLGEDG